MNSNNNNIDTTSDRAKEFPIVLQENDINILVSHVLNYTNKQIKRYDAVLFKNAYIVFHQYLHEKITREETKDFLRKGFSNLEPLIELDEIFAFARPNDQQPKQKNDKSGTTTDEEESDRETGTLKNCSTSPLTSSEFENFKDDMSPYSGGSKHKRRQNVQWSHKEDQKLIFSILKFSDKNWEEIANFMGTGRTKAMCAQRWNRVLNPFIAKCSWNNEEDDKLIKGVEKYGNRNWVKIATEIENRTDVQCRYRYRQLQKREQYKEKMNKNNHSEEEEETVDDDCGQSQMLQQTDLQSQNQCHTDENLNSKINQNEEESLRLLKELNYNFDDVQHTELQLQDHTSIEQHQIFCDLAQNKKDDGGKFPKFPDMISQGKCAKDIKVMMNKEEENPFFFFDEESYFNIFKDDYSYFFD